MKTNTTKLRRALTAFVLTGAMMPISDLCAADVTLDPAQAPQSVENANVVIPEGSAATIDAGGKVLLKGTGNNTLNGTGYTFTGAQQNGASIYGSIVSGGNWIITGGTFTGNTAKGPDVRDSIVYGGTISGSNIEVNGTAFFGDNVAKSGNTNVANDYHDQTFGGAVYGDNTVRIGSDDVVDNITFLGNIADATANTNKKNYNQGGAFGGAVSSQYGSITISAETGDYITFKGNKAIGEYSRARGGAIGSGRQGDSCGDIVIKAENGGTISFVENIAMNNLATTSGKGGAVYTIGNVTIVGAEFQGNEVGGWQGYGGAVCTDGKTLDITNATFIGNKSIGKTEAAFGGAIATSAGTTIISGTKFEGNIADGVYGWGGAIAQYDGTLKLTGQNTFKNNQSNGSGNAYGGAIRAKTEVIFFGDSAIAEFSGNTANGKPNDIHIQSGGSLTITDAGTYSFGGGITTGSAALGKVAIQNGANVTFEAGSITNINGAVTLDGANVTIKGTDGSFAAGSMTAKNGNKLYLVYTGSSDGKMLTGDVTGLAGSDMKLRFQSLEDGVVGRGANLTAEGLSTVVESDGKKFNLLRGEFTADSKYISKTDNIPGLAALENGDNLIIAQNGAAFQTGESLALPENFTIRSNSLAAGRTINANGNTGIFTTSGTTNLTLEDITISGAKNTTVAGSWISGSAITGGNWDITGGKFDGNIVETPDGPGQYNQRGGAISGSNINLNGVDFANNAVLGGDITVKTTTPLSQVWGGAVAGSQITISGESAFDNNTAKSGDVAAHKENTGVHDATWGGAVATNGGGSNITIGKDDVKDTISFTGNIADATATSELTSSSQGGAFGGAVGSDNGNIAVKAKAGDTILFENNIAKSEKSRAFGGAIATGRNSGSTQGTISIEAEKDGSVVFSGNTAVSEAGNLHVMGGAVYGRNNIDIDNAIFDGNTVSLENSNEAGAKGGAVYLHNADATLNIENSTFKNNAALVDGDAPSAGNEAQGGALAADGKIVLSGENTFANNKAENTVGDAQGGAIYGKDVEFADGSKATFTNNTANGKKNDIHAEKSVTFGSGDYVFDGGITTDDGGVMNANNANLTFKNGATVKVDGGTLDVNSLNIGSGVTFEGKGFDSVTVKEAIKFDASPAIHGFTKLITDAFTGEANVDLKAFTVSQMDAKEGTLTLIDGAKAAKLNIEANDAKNLMTDASTDTSTAVKINQDKNGNYGYASLADSKLVGIDFGGKDSLEVKDFSLLVDGEDIDLNAFADWLGDETGLKAVVGTGYVNVRLDSPFEIMASDSFIWDFSGYNNGAASLQFVTANIMDNAVPEPTTWALLVLGGLGIFGVARKNRKAKK